MSLGTLTCFVRNLHIGSLKKFGFNSAIMPKEVKDVTQEMLDDPLIQSALRAGVIEFTPKIGRGRPKREEMVEMLEVSLVSEDTGDGAVVLSTTEESATPEESTPVVGETVTEVTEEEIVETETVKPVEGELNIEEVFEALVEKLNAGQASDADIKVLFDIINDMNGFDAQKAVKRINDNVSLLTMLAEKCKFAKVQTAAKKKLESIQQ